MFALTRWRLKGDGLPSIVPIVLSCLSVWDAAIGHPGGLNAEGCHNDRKAGVYHCHGARLPSSPDISPGLALKGEGSVYYKNCSAAKQAGAAPVRRGDPGYGKHLDRDGDGVACEN